MCIVCSFFFFKQKTAYEMRMSDWSSDVCSSDLFSLFTEQNSPQFAVVVNTTANLRSRIGQRYSVTGRLPLTGGNFRQGGASIKGFARHLLEIKRLTRKPAIPEICR